jgi:signal transduction histidine kinase
MQSAVRAMDSISRALVRRVEGPRGLLEEVARAAADHLDAEWTLLALADGHLAGARPRFIAIDSDGVAHIDEARLPAYVTEELRTIRTGRPPSEAEGGLDGQWVWVSMTLVGDTVGALAAIHGLPEGPEASDVSVLRILANQAAVSLHTSQQYQAGLALHRRAQQLYDEATAQAQDLAVRTAELRAAERRLHVARQREVIDAERHRIARELHDSVTQYVLSAGMAVEVARGEAEHLGPAGNGINEQLHTAKGLSQQAVEQLRRAIYALHQPHTDTVKTLPELLAEVLRHHAPSLDGQLRVEGDVLPLPGDAHHEIARAVGEALFNVAAHAQASRVIVRLRYQPSLMLVTVSDDGAGDPSELARLLRLARTSSADGRHRGLVNIDARLADMGGSIAFRRARLGGVRVEMRLPLPLAEPTHPALIDGLVSWGPSPARS